LIISCDDESVENNVLKIIGSKVKKYVIKSKTVTGGKGVEFTIEIRLKTMETSFVNEVSSENGVNSAVLVSYNGDYMS